MRKMSLTLNNLKVMAPMVQDTLEEISAVVNLNDGTQMTSTVYVLKSQRLLNISNAVTYLFDSDEEMDNYMAKKFNVYSSDKEMWQDFTGMDDETWEEWNK